MRLQQTKLQRSKTIVHIAQITLIFIAGCLSVVLLTKNGSTDGRIGWFFGLCFLTLPAIVYQIMVPMWSRAWRFANVYAYAVIDVVFTILWFSAFVAVATWVNAGKSQGGKDQKKAASCDVFAFGSVSKCTTGETAIAFGVFIFLLFAGTSAISIHQAIRYRQSGVLPGNQAGGAYEATGIDAQTKDAWSADTDDLHSDPYHHDNDESLAHSHDTDDADQRGPHRGNNALNSQNRYDDEHALLHSTDPPGQQQQQHYSERPESWETEAHPGRPLSWGTDRASGSFVRVDTEYHGPSGSEGGGPTRIPDAEEYRTQSALSPGGYEADEGPERRPVQFPAGNY